MSLDLRKSSSSLLPPINPNDVLVPVCKYRKKHALKDRTISETSFFENSMIIKSDTSMLLPQYKKNKNIYSSPRVLMSVLHLQDDAECAEELCDLSSWIKLRWALN